MADLLIASYNDPPPSGRYRDPLHVVGTDRHRRAIVTRVDTVATGDSHYLADSERALVEEIPDRAFPPYALRQGKRAGHAALRNRVSKSTAVSISSSVTP